VTHRIRSIRRLAVLTCFLVSAAGPSLFGQEIRIAALSMGSGAPRGTALIDVARAVVRFDVVAADGIPEAGDMEKVLAGMDEGWEAVLNGDGGYYGFFYDERLQVVKELGVYRGPGTFTRPPYGVQFRLPRSRFTFNFVACRVRPGRSSGLAEVTRWFENLTGNRGITILSARFDQGQTPVNGRLYPGQAFHSRLGRSGIEGRLELAFLTLRAGQGG
jgi:hypothetical protein